MWELDADIASWMWTNEVCMCSWHLFLCVLLFCSYRVFSGCWNHQFCHLLSAWTAHHRTEHHFVHVDATINSLCLDLLWCHHSSGCIRSNSSQPLFKRPGLPPWCCMSHRQVCVCSWMCLYLQEILQSCNRKGLKPWEAGITVHLAVLSMHFVLWRIEKCDCAWSTNVASLTPQQVVTKTFLWLIH